MSRRRRRDGVPGRRRVRIGGGGVDFLEASLRTTSLNATCGGLCVAATFQLTAGPQTTALVYRSRAQVWARPQRRATKRGRGAAFRRLAPRLGQRLHDRSCNEQRDDG